MNNIFDEDYFSGRTTNYPKMFGGYKILNSRLLWGKRVNLIRKIISKGSVLDIGCAYGYLCRFLNGNYKKIGIDISKHAIKKCKEQRINARFEVLNFEKEFRKMNNQKFNLITCFQVLEHFKRPAEGLRNIWRLLKKGGYAFLSVPIHKDCHFGNLWMKLDHDPTHFHHLKKKEWLRIIRKAGFRIVDEWTSFFDELVWFRGLLKGMDKFGNFYYILGQRVQ